MEKTLNHIFDEANANEIDNLVKRNATSDISDETLSAIKDKVYAKTNLKKEKKNNRGMWMRFGTIAASFCLMLVVSIMVVNQIQNATIPGGPNIPPVTNNNFDSQFTVVQGICVGGKLYMPDAELSEKATEENIGAVEGYVSFDNITTLDVYAYEYVPNDGKTNKVIVSVKDSFYVYSFYSYMPNDSKNWIKNLLSEATYVEIRDVNYGTTDTKVYLTKSDLDDIIEFLSLLDEPHTQKELNQYYFEKFKNQFKEGEIWINKNGGIAYGGNHTVGKKFSNLVNGESRIIVVMMEDSTYLTYRYFEGAGVIRLEDSGCGYILTEEQIEKINHLIGLV